ncbi:carbohydrate-binding domain-containing protein [Robertmurraya kyonggiensis]|uniref:Carbohydrate-binding domain-containing protein n=1 Tax=Robertmurraya kyonggiensis TaxID=1037680 RepID=A0A4V5P137_9BACI|nr:carbohydrate-binding domain-containing protein [Robertmurraya kyonggiensis]TKC16780.1 carbohydrate-binding domain-containing protein [Robertmurraya kyonggiensis]
MKNKSKYTKWAVPVLCTALLFGCSNNGSDANSSNNSSIAQIDAESLSTIGDKKISDVISEAVTYEKDDLYSDWKNEDYTSIQLNGTGASVEGTGGAIVDGNMITIKTSGIYVISGTLNDGQIIVDAEDKATVRIVLNGVEINSSTNSPIYIKKAEKTVISLEEGTENYISDGNAYNLEDSEDEPNAAIFSKDNLTINGTGKLVVKGNYNNGITSKDELKITSGKIEIDSVDDGLMGRDLLAVKDGEISIKAGGDAVKSTNDKDASKGIIAIEGGTFNLTAENDGIQAVTSLLIADGDFSITTGGGSPETVAVKEGMERIPGQTNNTTTTETESDSAKGLKAGTEVAIGGGTFEIDTLDDAVHSNNSVTITGGELAIATGDDGIHGDSAVLTKGGNITISKSYEGIESMVITIADGDIKVNASDDGINIGGGNDGSNPDMQSSSSENNLLSIKGGNVYVNAQGDGLDSNGSISMTGGTVIVDGPSNAGNGALDYDQIFDMSGGYLIATGSSGMAQAVSDSSQQNSILMTYPEMQEAGTILHLEDSKGNTVATFAPEKDYQMVVISSPKLEKGSTYTLYSGGSATGNEENGYYTDGEYSGGTQVVEFTIEDSVTWLNESGITTAVSNGPGAGGQRGGFGELGGSQGSPTGDGQAQTNGGQTPPDGGNRGEMFSDLDDETRAKVQEIMEQERAGTLTREEAQAKLSELGVEFSGSGEMN